MMNLIQQIWLTMPDMRFHQLVDMLQHQFSKQKTSGIMYKDILISDSEDEPYTKIKQSDLFYVEDELFEAFLEEWLNNRYGK